MPDLMQELIEHNRGLIVQMCQDVADLESGRLRLYDGPGHENEITADWAAKKRAQIAVLERIVAAYEREKWLNLSPKKTKLSDAECHKRFVAKGEEVGASKDPKDFEKAFKKVTAPPAR